MADCMDVSVQGLTTAQARQRLAQYGYNDLVSTRQRSTLVEFLFFFANPLVLILLAAAFVLALVGDFVNAFIITTIVVLSIVLNFMQTFRSQRAVERLRAQVAPTASVLRDGNWVELPRRELVRDDVIQLGAGDLVPADAQLISARDLHVDEAALTGESIPVEKNTTASNDSSRVFLGTSVVSGTAIARITATGRATQFGSIAAHLAAHPPETEFERGLKKFSLLITRTVFFLVLFVFLITAVLRHNPFDSLLFSIALAVGLTPEFLPVINTITLGQGALEMSKQKVIVKHLPAIQNFGSIDILCSDKTGTLTSGKMTLEASVGLDGAENPRTFLFAYLNCVYQSGVENPTDTTALVKRNLNPLDRAILDHGRPDLQGYQKLDAIPFDFERRRQSVVVGMNGVRLLITKGATESILPLCKQYADGANCPAFDASAQAKAQATLNRLSAQGYRVLAVAYRNVPVQDTYSVNDECDLILLGFLAFADPPLPDALTTLEALNRDGVTVKILTGDSDAVARHVCAQVGLPVPRIVLGDQVATTSDTALGALAEQTVVFARVSPEQKNRILLALKRRGHVVGYIGDGINDAPSLHTADVGISVANAVDVAKDAAEIILLERNLTVLHNGILLGRKAFGNVIKYILMETSSNFGNVFSMAGAVLFLPFLPMLPTQILLNNFLYDLSQVTLPTDHVDETFIKKPQRWNIELIRNFMLFIGPISSLYDFLTFAALLLIFHAGETQFQTGWFVESLATQTLVIFVIRTARNPLQSRPSTPLMVSVLLVVLVGLVLPFSPLAAPLHFVPLPPLYFVFLAAATVTYLAIVQVAKRRILIAPT